MLRLQKQNKKNSPAEYDRIFKERAKKGPDWQDLRRWKTLLRYYKWGNILDIGCLDSRIIELVDPTFYMGIDTAKKTIKLMNSKYPATGSIPYFEVQDLYSLKRFPESRFKYVVMGEVLEHLEDPEKAIQEAFRILRPGGVLAISVPLEEARELGAVDKDRHLWSFTKDDILNLVKPYSSRTRSKVLRSKWFPRYKYCWPTLICWAWKK